MKPLRVSFSILRRRGPGYFWYLFSGWLLPRLLFKGREGLPGKIAQRFNPPLPSSVLLQRARAATQAKPGTAGRTSWTHFPVDPKVRAAVESARGNSLSEPISIGRIDDDGRVLGVFGDLPGLPCVTRAQFAERKRFGLDIVLWGDDVVVRKDYRGDQAAFVREWSSLALLAGKVNVPALHHVDEKHMLLYKSLIPGRTVRELLVSAGARILHAHTKADSALLGLDARARIESVWARGREFLPKVLPASFLERLEEQLERAHAEGVSGISLTWGNVVVEEVTNTPWFIDLDKASVARSRASLSFQLQRDHERELLNRLYGRALLTETSSRHALAEQSRKLPGWYAPIDFGYGLSVGGFWNSNSGTGRWECVNGPVLNRLLPGQRILDLGSNNGIMPVMMLRAGAKEVLGVELAPDYVDCAQLVRRIFEWRDQRRYDLKMHTGNMLDVLSCDWGRFDIVTAFCSLYYLEPDKMAAVVRKVAQLAPMMVLQAKTDTRQEAAENKAAKSSLLFLKTLLERNGFPNVEVHAPRGFTRPLLIGRKA